MRGLAWIYDVRMAQFVLKMTKKKKLSHIMGACGSQDLRSLSLIMAPGSSQGLNKLILCWIVLYPSSGFSLNASTSIRTTSLQLVPVILYLQPGNWSARINSQSLSSPYHYKQCIKVCLGSLG